MTLNIGETTQKHQGADDDIRYNYDLGGGGLMDMGCVTTMLYNQLYPVLGRRQPNKSLHRPLNFTNRKLLPPNYDSKVDRMTLATFAFSNDITGSIGANLLMPFKWKIIPAMPRTSTIVEDYKCGVD
ncbi:hypothetical protein L218DRAFT_990649 [Marasmius fiardii PR-910]|nr:hypothetical protein L218DRAFT_990649 [Marasmius fiardii PR-910]